MTTLLLVRHGPTRWNREKRYLGDTDQELLPGAEASIRRLAETVAGYDPEIFYTSPLKRARQTAALIRARVRRPVRVSHLLREMAFGQWEGRTAEELIAAKDPAYLDWLQGGAMRPPGGESFDQFSRRLERFVQRCLRRHTNQVVGVVAHAGSLRLILLKALGLSREHFFQFEIQPASLSVIRCFDTGQARLGCLNVTADG